MSNSDILGEVAAERARQDAKWGEQNHPDGTGPRAYPLAPLPEANLDLRAAYELADAAKKATDTAFKHGKVTYRDILLEEVFEALAESNPARLRVELVQVAAVAVAWVEKIDRHAAAGSAS